MPFTSEEERQQFQRRYNEAADTSAAGWREGSRRLVRLGFDPALLQEFAHDYWILDRVERDQENLRYARKVANETADLLKLQ